MKNKKLLLLLVVILAGAFYASYWYFSTRPKSTDQQITQPYEINYGPATDEQKNAATDNPSPKHQNTTDGTSSGSGSPSLSAVITAANQNGSLLQVRSLITPLVASGECQLTLSKQGQSPIIRTAAIQALSSSSTCQGFDIDTSTMTKGSWHIELVVTHEDRQVTASKDIEVK